MKTRNRKNKAKPIIPWMGGKTKLKNDILKYFPEHTCYVEPFAGGAALFFAKEPATCEVINDVNGELMNLYRVVQNHLDAFLDQFQWMLSSRESFDRMKQLQTDQLTDIQRAVRFFYLQKHAFGGHVHNQNFGTATTAPAKLHAEQVIQVLQNAHKRLKRTYIENMPWQEVIQRYDRPHSLHYCDPPYWDVAGYGTSFEWSEYEALKEKMETIKGMMLISINDHADIRALFDGFKMIPLTTTYTVGKATSPAKELLILNDHAVKALNL